MTLTLPPYITYSHGEYYRNGTTYYVLLIFNGQSEQIEAGSEKELKEKVKQFVNSLKTEE